MYMYTHSHFCVHYRWMIKYILTIIIIVISQTHTLTHTHTHSKQAAREKSRGLDYRYTDNINFWLTALQKIGLPKVSDIASHVTCIHYPSRHDHVKFHSVWGGCLGRCLLNYKPPPILLYTTTWLVRMLQPQYKYACTHSHLHIHVCTHMHCQRYTHADTFTCVQISCVPHTHMLKLVEIIVVLK
jgi:hypothetical protein